MPYFTIERTLTDTIHIEAETKEEALQKAYHYENPDCSEYCVEECEICEDEDDSDE